MHHIQCQILGTDYSKTTVLSSRRFNVMRRTDGERLMERDTVDVTFSFYFQLDTTKNRLGSFIWELSRFRYGHDIGGYFDCVESPILNVGGAISWAASWTVWEKRASLRSKEASKEGFACSLCSGGCNMVSCFHFSLNFPESDGNLGS